MMRPVTPSDGKSESFSQIYILDPDEQTRLRMGMNGGLEPQILRQLENLSDKMKTNSNSCRH